MMVNKENKSTKVQIMQDKLDKDTEILKMRRKDTPITILLLLEKIGKRSISMIKNNWMMNTSVLQEETTLNQLFQTLELAVTNANTVVPCIMLSKCKERCNAVQMGKLYFPQEKITLHS